MYLGLFQRQKYLIFSSQECSIISGLRGFGVGLDNWDPRLLQILVIRHGWRGRGYLGEGLITCHNGLNMPP